MHALYKAFLLYLTASTDKELVYQVEYLKAKNLILRGKLPKRITLTPVERQRLLKFGKLVGDGIKYLIPIVSPRTFMRWLSDETKPAEKPAPATPGRPKIEN